MRGADLNEENVDQDYVIDASVTPIGNRLCRRLPTGDTADCQSALPGFAADHVRRCAPECPRQPRCNMRFSSLQDQI